jgi:acyl-CoA thioesterase-2
VTETVARAAAFASAPAAVAAGVTLADVLDLAPDGKDAFRSRVLYRDEYPVYGGQLAAQALIAAGRTVSAAQVPNSLHMYFLSSGDAARPMEYRVKRDRDGRAFSARRVVVVQDGNALATMSCSFAAAADGPDLQATTVSTNTDDPGTLSPYPSPRLFGFECCLAREHGSDEWPTQFWCRSVEASATDGLMQAAVLAYLSDRSNGIGGLRVGQPVVPVSLDHAVWFHRAVGVENWVLMTLVPTSLSSGRCWYRGTVTDRAGVLLATLTQEVLIRTTGPAEPSDPPVRVSDQ